MAEFTSLAALLRASERCFFISLIIGSSFVTFRLFFDEVSALPVLQFFLILSAPVISPPVHRLDLAEQSVLQTPV